MSPEQTRGLAIAVLSFVLVIGAFTALRRPAPARVLSEVGGARYRLVGADARAAGARTLDAATIARGFTWAPGTDALSQQAVLTAVASARPEAQRLIGLVDGLTEITVGASRPGTLGTTTLSDDPGYDVTMDLGRVAQRYGKRGIDRVVLHELGHVVDHAIVPGDLDTMLDRATPNGYGCEQGVGGACASRDERFAESFAKWAMNDIGQDLNIGYRVMPPSSLQDWGRPLAALVPPGR